MLSARSEPAADAHLAIELEIRPAVVMDRVPTRTASLGFRNIGSEPVRVYLPNGETFRAGISTLSFTPEGAPPLFVPNPHGHGYVVTEADFHLLAPGESRSFPQRFTIDPFPPRGSLAPTRLPGFEPGRPIRVRWTYRNQIRRWEGGRQTFDGPTKALFGGADIPHIWTGELSAELAWTAPE